MSAVDVENDAAIAEMMARSCSRCGQRWSFLNPVEIYGPRECLCRTCDAAERAAIHSAATPSAVGRSDRDNITDARNHIRTALRELASLNTTIRAYAGDDDFDQPNRATVAMDELTLALDSLRGMS